MNRVTLVSILMLTLIVLAPTAVAGQGEVGEQIVLSPYAPEVQIEFPANTPFHVAQGHRLDPGEDVPVGLFSFELLIDGVRQSEDCVIRTVDRDWAPWILYRVWVYNDAGGRTGTHEFTGRWLAPCQWAVDHGYRTDPCADANARVEIVSKTLTVIFVP